jgi:hypothetical protein
MKRLQLIKVTKEERDKRVKELQRIIRSINNEK